jgi:CrcB protein
MNLILVALGGAAGSVLRYLTGLVLARLAGGAWPWGTMTVNILGSFLMGLAASLLLRPGTDPRAVPLVMAGFLGGFTTFSAFSLEVSGLWVAGRPMAALAYAGSSVVLGLLAFGLGALLARPAA